MAAKRREARGQLVARLVSLAHRAVGRKGQAAFSRQQKASAAGGCAGDVRVGKVEWLGGAEAGCLQALAKAGTNSPVRARTPWSHFFRVAREGLDALRGLLGEFGI